MIQESCNATHVSHSSVIVQVHVPRVRSSELALSPTPISIYVLGRVDIEHLLSLFFFYPSKKHEQIKRSTFFELSL